MLVVIATGGTGGHIYPALALGEMLKTRGHQVFFIGNQSRMEATVIPEAGFEFFGLESESIQGSLLRRVNAMFLMRDAYVHSVELLQQIKPDVVVGFGGYVTVPVVMAAKKLRIKVVLHEQNSIAGKANLFLQRYATAVVTSYPTTNEQFKRCPIYQFGNPRASYFKDCQRDGKVLKQMGLHQGLPTVLIVMGSLGSQTMNEKMLQFLKQLRDTEYQVIYLTGRKYYQEFMRQFNETKTVKVFDYLDMRLVLPNVDLIISRAGATTLTELTALGIPSILIPSPYVPMNHQFHNAMVLKNAGAALIIEEQAFSVPHLLEQIDGLLSTPEQLLSMGMKAKELGNLNACDDLCNLLEGIVDNESK